MRQAVMIYFTEWIQKRVHPREQTKANFFLNIMSSTLDFILHLVWHFIFINDDKDEYENKRKEKEQFSFFSFPFLLTDLCLLGSSTNQTKNFISLLIEFGMPDSNPMISSHFSKTIPAQQKQKLGRKTRGKKSSHFMLPVRSTKILRRRELEASPPSCLTPPTLHPWWRRTPTYLLPSPLKFKCTTLTVSDSESLAHHILLKSRQTKHGWEMRGAKCVLWMRKRMERKKISAVISFIAIEFNLRWG